jgi:hypothetical protein
MALLLFMSGIAVSKAPTARKWFLDGEVVYGWLDGLKLAALPRIFVASELVSGWEAGYGE